MRRSVCYIGFIPSGFSLFLEGLKQELLKHDLDLVVIGLDIRPDSFDGITEGFAYTDFRGIGQMPFMREEIEALIDLVHADFYLIWGGYYRFYARIRKLLQEKGIPHLLCENTSVRTLFFASNGLHGDQADPPDYSLPHATPLRSTELEALSSYIKPFYDGEDVPLSMEEYLQEHQLDPRHHTILFLGISDEAAGFNPDTSNEIQNRLCRYSTTQATIIDLIENLPPACNLLLKLHPHEHKTDQALLGELAHQHPRVHCVEKSAQITQFIHQADSVITAISTSSVLAAYEEKPILLLGETYLSRSTYSYSLSDYTSLSAALEALVALEGWEEKRKHRLDFFSHYLKSEDTYSVNSAMQEVGVKSHAVLVQRILSDLKASSRFEYHPTLPLSFLTLFYNRCLALTSSNSRLTKQRDQHVEQGAKQRDRINYLEELIRKNDNQIKQKDEQIRQKDGQIRQRDNQIRQRDAIIESAVLWQRSWVKRMFHRWRPQRAQGRE